MTNFFITQFAIKVTNQVHFIYSVCITVYSFIAVFSKSFASFLYNISKKINEISPRLNMQLSHKFRVSALYSVLLYSESSSIVDHACQSQVGNNGKVWFEFVSALVCFCLGVSETLLSTFGCGKGRYKSITFPKTHSNNIQPQIMILNDHFVTFTAYLHKE
jgi:hypothetical protein